MISYLIAHAGKPLPPFDTNLLFEYILAANGVFIRAERPGLKVLLKLQPLDPIQNAVRGLEALVEYVEIGKLPRSLLEIVLEEVASAYPNEALFYVQASENAWQMSIPEQIRSRGRVEPANPDDPAVQNGLVELHSHGALRAFFSTADDADEAFGFRVYCVIGEQSPGQAEIRCRIGVYGHFVEGPPEWLFDELPDDLLAWRTMVEIAGMEVVYDIPDAD